MGLLLQSAVQAAELAEAPNRIGYPSVAAALAAVRANPNVAITTPSGWTIADDKVSHALWSFTPAGHPAYPAVVKRLLVVRGTTVLVDMDVLCEASKPACGGLVRDFRSLNDGLKQKLEQRRTQ